MALLYHPQLVQLQKSLIHSGLVDLQLLFFFPQTSFKIAVAFSELGVDVVESAALVLNASQPPTAINRHDPARLVPAAPLRGPPFLGCIWLASKIARSLSLVPRYPLSRWPAEVHV